MHNYSILSNKLYKENFLEGCINFICTPSTLLCNELKRQIFSLIQEHKGCRSLSHYLDYLEGRPFNEKYLFILGLIFCIPSDNETERTDKSYWRNFDQNISTGINNNIPSQILSLVSRFCKNHRIPFFDVYQNKNQRNICSRIYSLMPFVESELQSLVYINQKEQINLQSDFILLKELILTSYSPLFYRATLEALKSGDEKFESLIEQDVLPLNSFNQLFSKYLERYWTCITKIPLPKDVKQQLEEKRKGTVLRSIKLQDFYVYIMPQDTPVVEQLYLQPRGSLLGEIEFDKMPLTIHDIKDLNKLKYKYLGIKKDLTFAWEKKYLVTSKPHNNGWLELEVDCVKRVYKKEVVGFVDYNNNQLQFLKMDLDQIDKEVKIKYSNIQGSTSIEFLGGLAYHYGRYMWFAIPDIIIHNDVVERIKMKLNDQDIPNNNAKSLKEKFYRYITNRKNVGQFPLEKPIDGEGNILSFWDNDGFFLDSIKIERQNYSVEKEANGIEFDNCPIERGAVANMSNDNYDATAFDYSHKREHLLFWMSRFQERGVSYERFKNALVSVYFEQLVVAESQPPRDLTTITKRIIEQLIGLGFIRAENLNNETRYILNKARFISTHNGQLLYTGARSYQQMKEMLGCDEGKHAMKIDTPFLLFDSIDMPSLLKYNTDEAGLIGMDHNEVVRSFIKDSLVINKRNVRESNIQSYPLYLLRTYESSQNSIVNVNPSLITKLDKYQLFDLNLLGFTKIDNISSIRPGAVLQAEEYGITQRYIAGECQDRDGEVTIQLFKVFADRMNDALYYCEASTPTRYLGWTYDAGKQALYIPRRINIPYQIRHALQCCLGCYTQTYFTKSLRQSSASPLIDGGMLFLTRKMGNGLIEVEEFTGITRKFLAEIEQKLNIQVKKITAECSHR